MTMTITCDGDCNHRQQSQCNAPTAMTMTCNGDYNHTAMTMTIKNNVSVIMTHSGMTMVCTSDYDPQGHNGLQKCACSKTCVCQRHSMHRPFKHYKYSAFHVSTPFRTIIAVQWMPLAHKYFGPRGDFANRCELFDVSTIQTLQL